MAEKPTQSLAPARLRLPPKPVLLVPGHHFFTSVAPLPTGTAERELSGLASLALEADSPFAEEQLARGYFARPGVGLLVFAAVRRKFAAEQESWSQAGFVVPDFATWLARGEACDGTVVLETAQAVTAMEFAAGATLPRQVVSRPVAADQTSPEDAIAQTRDQVLVRIGSTRLVRRFRLAETACTLRGGKFEFHWEPQGSGAGRSAQSAVLSSSQLWAMDLREPAFVRTRRRDDQWNRFAWGALVGLGVAAVALVLGEAGLLGAQLANSRRLARVEQQAPAARAAESDSDIVNRLAGYIERKPQPLELLAYVNDLRPRAIYFTKVSIEGGLQMVVDGSTSVLAEINEFEAALRRAPGFASVEVKNIRAREGGGTFQLTLVFRAGFPIAAAVAETAAKTTAEPEPEPAPVVASPAVATPQPVATPAQRNGAQRPAATSRRAASSSSARPERTGGQGGQPGREAPGPMSDDDMPPPPPEGGGDFGPPPS